MAKITHVISDGNVGGAGIQLSLLAGGLSSDFDTEIILPRGSELTDRLKGTGAKITEYDMAADKSLYPADIISFYKYFAKNTPDILHTHAALSARVGARLAGVRSCVSTRHCAIGAGAVRRRSAVSRGIYDYCTRITVATADYAKENLRCEGIPADRIVTIKNGVRAGRLTGEGERLSLRRSLGIPDGALILGSAARLEAVKGHDLIIRAAERLIKRHNIHLLFVGEGGAGGAIRELASSLGILKHLTLTGYKSDPTPYQNLFYINVNASRGTETSCLATSECMSLSIPSCVSNFGGNTEGVTHMENGVVFRSDDVFSLEAALDLMLCDKALYRRLCLGAYDRFVREFSTERMYRDYKGLYLSLLS